MPADEERIPLSVASAATQPPPYDAAISCPKEPQYTPPPNYYPEVHRPLSVIYVDSDDGHTITGKMCIYCGAETHRDVSICSLVIILFAIFLTYPFGIVLLCCVPCMFHRKCNSCGMIQ